VFVYDGNEGGAGFAERGFAVAREWLTATAEAITSCECQAGCPSCIQSPKCGTGNEPLAKQGALLLLRTLLEHAPRPATLGGDTGEAGPDGPPGGGAGWLWAGTLRPWTEAVRRETEAVRPGAVWPGTGADGRRPHGRRHRHRNPQ